MTPLAVSSCYLQRHKSAGFLGSVRLPSMLDQQRQSLSKLPSLPPHRLFPIDSFFGPKSTDGVMDLGENPVGKYGAKSSALR